jgi:tight adherence protein C
MAGRAAVGAVLGVMLGAGLLLIWSSLPLQRWPTLDQRLAPYLAAVRPGGSPVPGPGPSRQLARLMTRPAVQGLIRWVERISGGATAVRRRLDQLGAGGSVDQFRAEQLVWGLAGVVSGGLAGTGAVLLGAGVSAVPLVASMLIGGLLGVLGRDQALSWQVRRREDRILAEFPAVAELLALAVGAGEGAMAALDRVARVSHGELSAELRRTLADARTGASLVEALDSLGSRTSLPSLARFADGVAVAVERGTPLADVLRAQARDVRTHARRQLMEAGGRREIWMMIPVVFLVLPVTVLYAVYPGLIVLDLR